MMAGVGAAPGEWIGVHAAAVRARRWAVGSLQPCGGLPRSEDDVVFVGCACDSEAPCMKLEVAKCHSKGVLGLIALLDRRKTPLTIEKE